ncbi:MAG: DUF4286 family protein [Flavicella sp.]
MYIYNITTNIQEEVVSKWLTWMQEIYIPDMLATGKFLSAKMCKVLVEEDMGGVTYSVQYEVQDKETLAAYHKEDALQLKNKANAMFAGQFVYFETELQLIDRQFASKN